MKKNNDFGDKIEMKCYWIETAEYQLTGKHSKTV